jgi:hypothetical protein
VPIIKPFSVVVWVFRTSIERILSHYSSTRLYCTAYFRPTLIRIAAFYLPNYRTYRPPAKRPFTRLFAVGQRLSGEKLLLWLVAVPGYVGERRHCVFRYRGPLSLNCLTQR